jgi:hypothetical protein
MVESLTTIVMVHDAWADPKVAALRLEDQVVLVHRDIR